jgi:hypothetical protein
MLLSRRHKLSRVFPVAALGFVVALSSLAWPIYELRHFEQLRPHKSAIDRTVMATTVLCWGTSVFSWLWVENTSWLTRSLFVCFVLVLWFGIVIAAGLTVAPLYSALTGI